FQDAYCGVERGASAFGGFAVPPAVRELLGEKTTGEALGWVAKVGTECERASIDARLDFASEERFGTEFFVPTVASLESRDSRFDGSVCGVDAGGAQELHGEEGRQPVGGTGAVPGAVRSLAG